MSDSLMIFHTLKLICDSLEQILKRCSDIHNVNDFLLTENGIIIPWKNVMGVRDIIVHHYFDVDADEIFRICQEDIPQLLQVIRKMLNDLHND